jgi:hypothetical protein
MRVVEQFVLGKRADPALCEDAIVVTAGFAAVVDGATDVSGRLHDGVSGGRWAMAACAEAVRALPAGVDAYAAVEALTGALAGGSEPANERPTASVTVYSAARREIWQVGDVGFRFAGLPGAGEQPRKLVDEVAAAFRAAVLAAEDAAGDRGAGDPGRIAARALISRQGFLCNTIGPYGYAAIDGRPVLRSMIVIHDVPPGELIIASDGYPVIEPTLAEAEATLARLLELDPRCVAELRGTKGLEAGQVSFDDRAYLRLVV